MNPLKPISEIMSHNLVSLTPGSSISEARETMKERRMHHLIIVHPEGTLAGILSRTDLLKLLDMSAEERARLTVGDLMTGGLAKLDHTDTVRTAASVFALNRFHALPVVDGDKAIGIVTTHDLIKLIDDEKVELSDYQK